MQKERKELEDSIAKYIDGAASQEERRSLEAWVESLDIPGEDTVERVDKSVLKRRIDRQILDSQQKVRRIYWTRVARISAILLMVFGMTFYIFKIPVAQDDQYTLVDVDLPTILPKTRVVYNSLSLDSVIQLSDGSLVTLQPGAKLTWREPFDEFRRQVKLEGKAFFDIARDKKRPFSVWSGDFLTTALGTSFWVDFTDPLIDPDVVLVTGKVVLKKRTRDGQEEILCYLAPGERWHSGKKIAKKDVDKGHLVDTTVSIGDELDTELIFHHTPLEEVLTQLAIFYHVEIDFVPEEVEGLSFYGTIGREKEVQHVLHTIAIANDLQLSFDPNTVNYQIRKQ